MEADAELEAQYLRYLAQREDAPPEAMLLEEYWPRPLAALPIDSPASPALLPALPALLQRANALMAHVRDDRPREDPKALAALLQTSVRQPRGEAVDEDDCLAVWDVLASLDGREDDTGDEPAVQSTVDQFLQLLRASSYWNESIVALSLRGCLSVSSQGLTAVLASGLRNLASLDVSGTDVVDDAFLLQLAACNLVNLRIGGARRVSEDGMLAFLDALPRLVPLDRADAMAAAPTGRSNWFAPAVHFWKVDSDALYPALRRLDISEVAVTDRTLERIGEAHPQLIDLCLFCCARVTDNGIISLCHPLSRLRRLCSAGAYKVTEVGRRALLSDNPRAVFYIRPSDFGLR